MILYISVITIYWKITDYFLSGAVSNQTKVFYPKKRKQAEQRKARGKAVKKRKLSAKSGRGGNPDKNSLIVKIFIAYEFLPSTRFLCGKAGKIGTAENERKKSKKAEEVATLSVSKIWNPTASSVQWSAFDTRMVLKDSTVNSFLTTQVRQQRVPSGTKMLRFKRIVVR